MNISTTNTASATKTEYATKATAPTLETLSKEITQLEAQMAETSRVLTEAKEKLAKIKIAQVIEERSKDTRGQCAILEDAITVELKRIFPGYGIYSTYTYFKRYDLSIAKLTRLMEFNSLFEQKFKTPCITYFWQKTYSNVLRLHIPWGIPGSGAGHDKILLFLCEVLDFVKSIED